MSNMNNYKIIVPLFNVDKWIDKCIKSVQLQEYENYECYLIDDLSTDDTIQKIIELIKDDKRFHLIRNKEKKYALRNIYETIQRSGSDAEDIIVTLDGDDWFATKKALNVLNEFYDEYHCHMTYGSYIEYPSMKRGSFSKQIPHDVIKNKSYRKSKWMSSHLRSFKRHLVEKIKVEDLLDEDNKFYKMAYDMALVFPMLEMAGPLAIHIPQTLYAYNRQNPLNDDKVNHRLQLETERKFRNKDSYRQDFVTCDILGPTHVNPGLGNQLFCIANTIAYGLENNKVAYFPTILKTRETKKYSDLYKRLNIGLEIPSLCEMLYKEQGFQYQKIDHIEGNVKLSGYFQSHKYFEKYRNEVMNSLSIIKLQESITRKYGDFSKKTAIHIRRGDYCSLQHYHNLLGVNYYKKAISIIGNDRDYVIFSDDLEWCKENVSFISNVEFVSCEEDWEEMILMSTFENNIIANSTFSWWSAWFNQSKEKKVIAPKKWFADKNKTDPSDIQNPEWNWL